MADNIQQPSYYLKGGIDLIDFLEQQGRLEEIKHFSKVNILKYVLRYEEKNGMEDLKKAFFYLNKLIELEGK